MGYHRAGFNVTGVDLSPQPNYPFAFVQSDAIQYLAEHGSEYDAIHASPPCQAFTQMSARWRGRGGKADEHQDLLTPIRALLASSRVPYIIENVMGARRKMGTTFTLHGGMFGLGVHRPRLFESNVLIFTRDAGKAEDPVGVYGRMDGRRLSTRADGTEQRNAKTLAEASAAMGIDWMTWDELREAIPPAYTEFIGRQLLAACFPRLT